MQFANTILEYKRDSECHNNRHIPHEKGAAVVWTREKERRARAHATSAQHDTQTIKWERLRFMDITRRGMTANVMEVKDV